MGTRVLEKNLLMESRAGYPISRRNCLVLREMVVFREELRGEAAGARAGMTTAGAGDVVGVGAGADDPSVLALSFGQAGGMQCFLT